MRKCFPDPFRVRVAFRQQQLQINQLSGRVAWVIVGRPDRIRVNRQMDTSYSSGRVV